MIRQDPPAIFPGPVLTRRLAGHVFTGSGGAGQVSGKQGNLSSWTRRWNRLLGQTWEWISDLWAHPGLDHTGLLDNWVRAELWAQCELDKLGRCRSVPKGRTPALHFG